MSKITMTTLKSFIRKNDGKLFIRTESSFDGMTDCVQQCEDRGWSAALPTDLFKAYTLGIQGAWCVGGSRDYLSPVVDGPFIGFHVSNCCGSFDLAVRA